MKRQILILSVALGISFTGFSQNMLRAVHHSPGASLKSSLENILKDYPNAYKNVMGAERVSNPEFTEFECVAPLPGAVSSWFSRFNTPNGNVVSFEAVMLRTDDFHAAASRYKSVCSELKRGIINMGKHRPYIMDGKFNSPTDEKRFNETVYALLPADLVVDKLKIVVALEYVFPEWELRIKMYDKGKDDEEAHGDEDDEM